MARIAIAHVRGGFAMSPIARVVLRSENERLRGELAQARECQLGIVEMGVTSCA